MIVNMIESYGPIKRYRALAIDVNEIASIVLLDPMEVGGGHASILSFKSEIGVGLDENLEPVMKKSVVVSGNIRELVSMTTLDPTGVFNDEA